MDGFDRGFDRDNGPERDRPTEAARLTRPGTDLIATHEDRGPPTYVMRDPEGNEFCQH